MAESSAKHRAAGSFDAFRLSHEHGVLQGRLDAASLPRVADRLADGAAPIVWRISGAEDGYGRAALDIDLDGHVCLECQRCLATFEWPVRQSTTLLLARNERELARLDADNAEEVALASGPLDPRVLVEDELTLLLPFAPRHPEGTCSPPAAQSQMTATQ
jgi:DUF177 domain-containing protein